MDEDEDTSDDDASARAAAAAQEPLEPVAPYEHDPALVPVMARVADAACHGVTNPLDAAPRVQGRAAQADPPVERSAASVLFHTFFYVLKIASADAVADASLHPLDGAPSGTPIPLRESSRDMRQLWLALAGEVTHPVARARCWDIVFTLGLMRNGRDAAESAARAYMEANLALRWQAEGLLRAWTLCRQVGLSDLEREITTVMIGVVEDALARKDDAHAVIPLFAALIAPARRSATAPAAAPRIDSLLDQALVTYQQVDVIADIVTLVRKRAGGGSARAEHAARHELAAMLAAADAATEPMIIRKWLNDTASTARRYGIGDVEKVAVAKLQAAPALDWESTGYEINLPPGLFDTYLPGFNETTTWQEALSIWLHTDSPAGRLEVNEATARSMQQTSVFRYLATTIVFGDGDMPARTITGDEVFTRDLAHVETMYYGAYGTQLANAMYMIASRFGIPSRQELEEFLQGSNAAPTMIKALATALQLFWVGEYEAAAHLVVPKVEAAVRALLLELNEPLYRPQAGDTPGQFPGLGSLLPSLLANGFDPDWERFLRTFLLGEGSNVRNFVAHGFIDTIDALNTALALRAFAVVALLTNSQAVTRDADAVKAALANPNARPQRRWWQRITAAVAAAWFELRRI